MSKAMRAFGVLSLSSAIGALGACRDSKPDGQGGLLPIEARARFVAKCFAREPGGLETVPQEWKGQLPNLSSRQIGWAKTQYSTNWWLVTAVDLVLARVVAAFWVKTSDLETIDSQIKGTSSTLTVYAAVSGELKTDISGTRPPPSVPVPVGIYVYQVSALIGADCGTQSLVATGGNPAPVPAPRPQ